MAWVVLVGLGRTTGEGVGSPGGVGGGSQALRVSEARLPVRGLATVIFRTFRLCLRSENAVGDPHAQSLMVPTLSPR